MLFYDGSTPGRSSKFSAKNTNYGILKVGPKKMLDTWNRQSCLTNKKINIQINSLIQFFFFL